MTVKRKFQEGEPGRRHRWWYLIRGSEAALTELESLWSSVSLQVGWKLESCTKPRENDDSTTDATANTNDNEDSDEGSSVPRGPNQNTAMSNSHPCPPAVNSPETDSARSPDQPNNELTGTVDNDVVVNTNNNATNSRQNNSHSHSSHHNTSPTPSTDSSPFLDH